MDLRSKEENDGQMVTVKKSFTQALREKYCMSDGGGYDSINVIISPKRKNATAELGHLRTIVLNNMNIMNADIPHQGLICLCPNVVDLDLANNLLNKWSELLAILCHMPQLKFVNASKNCLNVDTEYDDLPKTPLNIENLALNYTGITIEDITHISQIMPALKELHLCGNDYEHLGSIDDKIKDGAFSSLECLRLNNNRIKSWAEIWKLRNLKCLKSLVLSDNPVSHLFYRREENGNDLTCVEDIKPQQTKEGPELDSPDVPRLQNDYTSGSKLDGLPNRVMDDVKCNFGEISVNESINCMQMNYKTDPIGDDVARPVSRIGRHEDSDVEDQEEELSDEENVILHDTSVGEHDEDIQNLYPWFDAGQESNDSFNTNSSILTVTDDDSFMDITTGTDGSDTDMPKESHIGHDHCDFTLIAESFLYDIINKIDFLSSQTSTTTNECPTNIKSNSQSSTHTQSSLSTVDLNTKRDNVSHSGDRCLEHVNNQMELSPMSKQTDEIMIHHCEHLNQTIFSNSLNNFTGDVRSITTENNCKNCLLTTLEDGSLICNSCHTSVADVKHYKQISDSGCKMEDHSFPSSCNCQHLIQNERKQNLHDSSLCYQFHDQLSVSNTERNKGKSDLNSLHYGTITSKLENATEDENCKSSFEMIPFENLEMLCLSSTCLSHWKDLDTFSLFPKLTSLRVQCNPLYSTINTEDRRKLYIASLPNVNILNGSEVSATEREKAERHYLRHFMHDREKPDIYHRLVQIHGEPVELVDIDLSAGYQEWALLDFICDGDRKFSKKVHLTDQVGKLRLLISQTLLMPKNCFIMHYNPCSHIHPEYERDMTELRCESLPMSRFNFADGDEIHIEIKDL